MMKNKLTRVVLIAILASLLSYNIVQACSPVVPRILVKCSNLEVSIEAGTQPVAGDTYESILKRQIEAAIKNLRAVVPNCEEDLTPVLPEFEQEISRWLDYRNNKRGAFLDGDLALEPYSAGRDSELQQKKNSLLSCGYEEYKHFGDWLIVFETSRPYCYDFWYAPGMCPSINLSLGHFLFYLVANFSLSGLPYLAGLLIAGTTIIYVWWKLLRNRPVVKVWIGITLSFAVLIAELFMIVMPVWLFVQIIGWIALFGLLVVWYKYFKEAEERSKSKAG